MISSMLLGSNFYFLVTETIIKQIYWCREEKKTPLINTGKNAFARWQCMERLYQVRGGQKGEKANVDNEGLHHQSEVKAVFSLSNLRQLSQGHTSQGPDVTGCCWRWYIGTMLCFPDTFLTICLVWMYRIDCKPSFSYKDIEQYCSGMCCTTLHVVLYDITM